jgi:hypothetical protein
VLAAGKNWDELRHLILSIHRIPLKFSDF